MHTSLHAVAQASGRSTESEQQRGVSCEVLDSTMELHINKLRIFYSLKEANALSTKCNDSFDVAYSSVTGQLAEENVKLASQSEEEVRKTVSRVVSKIKSKWNASRRTEDRFLQQEAKFLESDILLSVSVKRESEENVRKEPEAGRPKKSFSESSARSRRRLSMSVAVENETEKLVQAASQKARMEKNPVLASVLKQTISSPGRPLKMRRAIAQAAKLCPVQCLTGDEALAVCVAADLTKHSYLMIRKIANKAAKTKLFPAYEKVRAAKKKCYPDPHAMTFTETSAEVKLQAILDHTCRRLVETQREHVQRVCIEQSGTSQSPGTSECTSQSPGTSECTSQSTSLVDGILRCKWGFDGATGQAIYKQKYTADTATASREDEALFCTTLVPLELTICGQSIWSNDKPSSTRFCRPLRLQYVRETPEVSRADRDHFVEQVASLSPTEIEVDEVRVRIRHELELTMIDGKVANALTNTSSSLSCSICGAKPTQMNQVEHVTARPVNPDACRYGLSPLHAWIRLFECVIHIGYRLKLKVWSVRQKHQEQFKAEKSRIQREFREKMGLVVDMPRAGGAGTTNDGNTARRAFRDPEMLSQITGVDLNLITRFSVILQAISSSRPVDADKFDAYALETAKLFSDLYSWFYMPASLHKLLIHGGEVIRSLLLPIGCYSEEAQESRNKDNRLYRIKHARKTSRTATITDQFCYLLITSDPSVSNTIRSEMDMPQRARAKRPEHTATPNPLLHSQEDKEAETDREDSPSAESSGTELLSSSQSSLESSDDSCCESAVTDCYGGDVSDSECVFSLPSYYCEGE